MLSKKLVDFPANFTLVELITFTTIIWPNAGFKDTLSGKKLSELCIESQVHTLTALNGKTWNKLCEANVKLTHNHVLTQVALCRPNPVSPLARSSPME